MTTPYVYVTTRTDTPEPQQQDVAYYFWGGVITLLLLAAVVFIVMYGMTSTSTEASAALAPSDRSVSVAATMLTQLPLYLGSTQYADPVEDA